MQCNANVMLMLNNAGNSPKIHHAASSYPTIAILGFLCHRVIDPAEFETPTPPFKSAWPTPAIKIVTYNYDGFSTVRGAGSVAQVDGL